MPRMPVLERDAVPPPIAATFDAVRRKLGVTPAMVRTMANAPAVMNAYLGFAGALAMGQLGPTHGELIALAVAEANRCGYCLSAHTAIGAGLMLPPTALEAARRGHSDDPRTMAILQLALGIVSSRGHISEEAYEAARSAGLSEGEIAEVVGHVGLNLFTNYFNLVAGTPIDFPAVLPQAA